MKENSDIKKDSKEKFEKEKNMTTIKVSGMTCEHCEKKVSDALEKTGKAKNVEANHENSSVKFIDEGITEEEIKKRVEEERKKIVDEEEKKEKERGLMPTSNRKTGLKHKSRESCYRARTHTPTREKNGWMEVVLSRATSTDVPTDRGRSAHVLACYSRSFRCT